MAGRETAKVLLLILSIIFGSFHVLNSIAFLVKMFLKKIKEEFGLKAYNHIKSWIDINSNIREENGRKDFLLNCRSNHIGPKFILNSIKIVNQIPFHSYPAYKLMDKINEKYVRQIRNQVIRNSYVHLTFLNKFATKIKECLENTLSNQKLNEVSSHTVKKQKILQSACNFP